MYQSLRNKMKINKLDLLKKTAIFLTVFVCTLLINFELYHYYNHGHFVSYGLHVEAQNEDYNISISGQTKLYWAEITNYSFLKIKITQCDYISDANLPGSKLPFAIQRWNDSSRNWETIKKPSKQSFCKPVPLSTIETNLTSKLLSPFEKKRATGSGAVGAMDSFRQGDMARFVIFINIEKGVDWENAIPSAPFYIHDNVIRYED